MLPLSAWAQTPVDELENAPATAQRFSIVSIAGVHGHSASWTRADGAKVSRDSLNLRGQVWEEDQTVTYGPDGMPRTIVVRGVSPQGDAGETFAITDGDARWKSPIDAGSARYVSPAFYVTQGGTLVGAGGLVESLLKAPDTSLALLPGGRATAARLTEAVVGEGTARKTVVAYAISGISNSPVAVWTTEDGRFFASIGALSLLPEGYEGALSQLNKAQDEALARQSPKVAHRFLKAPRGAVAFTHVRLYDAEERVFRADQTVVVARGVITSVGTAAEIRVPPEAVVIDGRGKTLVPGLWDSHQHVGDDFSGPMLLSLGVTSARDPGNDNDLTLARARRRAGGDLLSPEIYPSVLIDGRGPHTAQVASVAESPAQAVAIVDKARDEGFGGIKLYGSLPRGLVMPITTEAHRLGLHVHGHIPAGMRTRDAIDAGYDEITHIYFVMMQAMPQDVVDHSNGILRMQGMGRYAKDVDLEAEPMKGLIAEMARRRIVSDPTLVVVESLLSAEAGELSPAYAPFVSTLPPTTERGFKTGGLEVAPGYTRADYRAGFRKLEALVLAMHRAGVPIVAGTDGSGLELVRELELYVDAGFTPAEALATATIVPARLAGAGKTKGSIQVGKTADLVLVEGDPSTHIGDLRNTRVVMMGGIPMDADALRAASGFSGRPGPQARN